MKTIIHFVLLLILLLFSPISINLAGDHTVQANIEITSTAINRYLNNQYNQIGFPRSFNVVYNGTTYTFSLTLPEIILTPNNAKLRMIFDINTGTSNVYHFEINPSISIPPDQITLGQVSAFLTNLVDVLNSITFIPQWVRDNIVQYYNSLGFIVYPSQLVDELDDEWIRQRGLTIDPENIALSYQVAENAFKFILSIPIHAQAPRFFAKITYNQYLEPAVTIESYDIDCTIDEVRIFNSSGQNLQTWADNIELQKGVVQWDYINFQLQPTQMYPIWILFRIGNYEEHEGTFYVRRYNADGQGIGSNQVGSIN